MNDEELLDTLTFLVEKYVPAEKQRYFTQLLSRPDIPVKGILADFGNACHSQVEAGDGALIRKLYFYNC